MLSLVWENMETGTSVQTVFFVLLAKVDIGEEVNLIGTIAVDAFSGMGGFGNWN